MISLNPGKRFSNPDETISKNMDANINPSPKIGHKQPRRLIIGISLFLRITMSRIAKTIPSGSTNMMQRITGITSIPIVPATRYVKKRQERLRNPKGIL